MLSRLFVVFLILSSYWFWKIWSVSWWLAIVCVLTTVLLYENSYFRRWLGVGGLIFLIFYQLLIPKTVVASRDAFVIDQRWQMYANAKLPENKWLWKIPQWFEVNELSHRLGKMQENAAVVLNPGYYFFANHPFERVGIMEFEKFWFGLLVPWIIGLFVWFEDMYYRVLLLVAVGIATLVGESHLGAVFLLPIVCCQIALGLTWIYRRIGYEK